MPSPSNSKTTRSYPSCEPERMSAVLSSDFISPVKVPVDSVEYSPGTSWLSIVEATTVFVSVVVEVDGLPFGSEMLSEGEQAAKPKALVARRAIVNACDWCFICCSLSDNRLARWRQGGAIAWWCRG